MRKVHPAFALAAAAVAAPGALAVCDHRTGSPALMAESLALQARLGPVSDITADCAEGARAVGAPLPDDVRQAFFATDTDPKKRTSP